MLLLTHALLCCAVRSVDADYLGTLLEVVLLTGVEHGWADHAIPARAAGEALAAVGYDPRQAQPARALPA